MSAGVLVVEDDEDVRENLALLLELKGYRVQTARHGQEALDRISRADPPCVVILDLMMPVMDGWELSAALRRDPVLAEVPVVLLSGITDIGNAARTLDAVDHLRKPVDFDKLYRLVGAHCGARKPGATGAS